MTMRAAQRPAEQSRINPLPLLELAQAWSLSCAAVAASMSKSLTCCTKSSSAAAGRAPAWLKISLPFLNAISVGIDRIWAAAASSCSASVSTLACTTSGCLSADAENVGANWRHGPHQDAQKSTSTMSLPLIVSLNCAAVRSWGVTTSSTLRPGAVFPRSGQVVVVAADPGGVALGRSLDRGVAVGVDGIGEETVNTVEVQRGQRGRHPLHHGGRERKTVGIAAQEADRAAVRVGKDG